MGIKPNIQRALRHSPLSEKTAVRTIFTLLALLGITLHSIGVNAANGALTPWADALAGNSTTHQIDRQDRQPPALAARQPANPPDKPDSIDLAKDAQQKGLLRIYRSNLLKKTYQYVVYPDSAIDNNHEGDVILRITVDRSGKVTKIRYDSRAVFNSLNKAAKKAIQNAAPYPAVPSRIEGETFELLMPIRFRLTG